VSSSCGAGGSSLFNSVVRRLDLFAFTELILCATVATGHCKSFMFLSVKHGLRLASFSF
jgi:hypothetical protein